MTFAIFITGFILFFFAILNALPDAEPLPATFADSFTTIIGYMKAWNSIFPITEMLYLLGFFVAFEITLWLLKWTMRLIHIIRGTGTQ